MVMELLPGLQLGWLNGWIPYVVLVLVEGALLRLFPDEVRARLLDRSLWTKKQATITAVGKLFSLACIVLVVLTPLKTASLTFYVGMVIYTLGLAGLIVALSNFRSTPLGEPVSAGLYRVSRHPQLLALFVAFLGMTLAIGSWTALVMLVVSRVIQHYSILAEEQACLEQYGESYREYMRRVPRYLGLPQRGGKGPGSGDLSRSGPQVR
jgi:protein-S-isoprenylcysteine O-methyltransferase Ste14